MKQFFKKIGYTTLLLIPLSMMGQKNFSKEAPILNKLGLRLNAQQQYTTSQAKQLMKSWDSLYDIGKKQQINNVLSDTVWEQLIHQEIAWAKLSKNKELDIRLHYYLAHTYHSRKQFSKSIPIQEQLIHLKKYLTKNQFQKTLARLERAYVQTNELNKALNIRKIRLEAKFVEASFDLYQDFELHELALKDFLYYEKFEQIEKVVDQYKYYKILGNLYFDLNKVDSAKKYFQIGLAICNKNIKDLTQQKLNEIHLNNKANFIGLLGKCYLVESDYHKAIQFLSIDIKNSDEDINNKIFKMIHLTNAYIGIKDWKNSSIYVKEIDQLSKDKEDKRILIRVSEMKSKFFILKKQLDSALFYANQYNKIKDIQNENLNKNQAILLLSNIQAEARKKDLLVTKATLDKERADKKAQQIFLWASIIILVMAGISIVILIINNIQKSKSKALIELKNEENELLLKELHHRVKNNLQVIYSLINLQKRRLETPELHQSLSMVQNRIKTMSLVHQNLHENNNLKDVNLEVYIKTISDYLKTLYHREEKEIQIELDVDNSIELSMDRAITIGLLINEIMSNSLKYAFRGRSKGKISINVQKIHTGFQMKISDNGIGFTNSTPSSKSLGMFLIENLVKQIQGRYEVESFEGTTYLIYFNA